MVMIPLIIAVIVALVVVAAEWLHARRVDRVARLAFGPSGTAHKWTAIVPPVRVVAAAITAWGLCVLAIQEPEAIEAEPDEDASRHLLVCIDASPSMFVEDAGPSGRTTKRAIWAGELIQGILDRLDTATTRVTVFAVYTKALPVVEETFDLNVVRNMLDGLPLYSAFEAGPTNFMPGVSDALDYARAWQPNSATLVVLSDGDFETTPPIRSIPTSIADSIVIGVGDPVRPTMVSGHRSRQETASLRTLASQLRGIYHEGNTHHLPSGVLDQLTMIRPRVSDAIGLRELAFVAVGVGSSLLAFVGPLLVMCGRRSADILIRQPRSVREVHPPERTATGGVLKEAI